MINYDEIATGYDDYGQTDMATEIELGHKIVAKALGNHLRGKILDYGCGSGKFSRFLSAHGARIVGVDVSRKQIEIAGSYGGGIDYRVIESGGLDGLSSDFDAVTFSFVLLTIPSKEEIVKILMACRAKIKPNGKLVILNSNMETGNGKEFVSYKIQALHDPKSGDPVRVWLGTDRKLEIVDYYWTQTDYIEMLGRSGFVLEEVIEPKPVEGNGWLDEWEHSPCKIFVARPI
jgi:toxoflavin synthase